MNNEPVAWMKIETDDEGKFRVYSDTEPVWDDSYIPLYTHPPAQQWTIEAKFKELTDEEIMECFKDVNLFTANMVDVARAILRKAQEK